MEPSERKQHRLSLAQALSLLSFHQTAIALDQCGETALNNARAITQECVGELHVGIFFLNENHFLFFFFRSLWPTRLSVSSNRIFTESRRDVQLVAASDVGVL